MQRRIPKKRWQIGCLLILFSILLWMGPAGAKSEDDVFFMGWEPWEPYQFENQQGHLTGLDIELIRAIMNVSNIPVKFKKIPWKRHLEELKRGEIDMAAGASITPERKTYAYFSEPYRKETAVLYVRKDKQYNITRLKDIMGMPFQLVVCRGYYYGEAYDKLIKNPMFQMHVGEVTDQRQCYQMLQHVYIDGFLADPISATAGLRRAKMLDEVKILFTTYSDNIYIMFSKKTTPLQLVEKFNNNLVKLKKIGTHQRILDKYLKRSLATSMVENEGERPTEQLKVEGFDFMKRKNAFQTLILKRYLLMGSIGEDVVKLQIILQSIGLYHGKIDGIFGPMLSNAAVTFQKQNNLSPDGIGGPLTHHALGTFS